MINMEMKFCLSVLVIILVLSTESLIHGNGKFVPFFELERAKKFFSCSVCLLAEFKEKFIPSCKSL